MSTSPLFGYGGLVFLKRNLQVSRETCIYNCDCTWVVFLRCMNRTTSLRSSDACAKKTLPDVIQELPDVTQEFRDGTQDVPDVPRELPDGTRELSDVTPEGPRCDPDVPRCHLGVPMAAQGRYFMDSGSPWEVPEPWKTIQNHGTVIKNQDSG